MHPHRLGYVLQLRLAQIVDGQIKSLFHLPISILGKADGTGLGYTF
jgi:hypothetical protein